MNNKQVKRLFDLNKRANSCEPFTSEEITERNDLQFLRNKQNVNMRLTGNNKYYHANQCQTFIRNIEKYGFNGYHETAIDSVYITSSPYYGASIKARLISGGETDIKAFNENKELLGFIIGYNSAVYNFTKSKAKKGIIN
jgi:hypothetical protein|tara:strand:+ start:84 stop:503 length:420 start_codon:yes stop_codon:yes gene_type:complete